MTEQDFMNQINPSVSFTVNKPSEEFLSMFLPPKPRFLMVNNCIDSRTNTNKTFVTECILIGKDKFTIDNLKILDEFIEDGDAKRMDVEFLQGAQGDVIIGNGVMTERCEKCWNKELIALSRRENAIPLKGIIDEWVCSKCGNRVHRK